MTREEALEFLRQNALTNMRLALLEDRPDKDYIRALIDVVEGNTDEVRATPRRFVDNQGGVHYASGSVYTSLTVSAAQEFGVWLTLRDAGECQFWLKSVDSDQFFAVVERWGYLPATSTI